MHGNRLIQTASLQNRERTGRKDENELYAMNGRKLSLGPQVDNVNFGPDLFTGKFQLQRQRQLNQLFASDDPAAAAETLNQYPRFPSRLWDQIHYFLKYRVVNTNWFRMVILVIIFLNCISLSLLNPPINDKAVVDFLNTVEVFFLSIFVAEVVLKIVANGLFRLTPIPNEESRTMRGQFVKRNLSAAEYAAENGYFRSWWNILDFIVVINGVLQLSLGGTSALTALRAVRLLRPLRAIQRVPRLRIIIQSAIQALPAALKVGFVLLFLLLIFSGVAVSLFRGKLRSRCYTFDDGVYTILSDLRDRPCDVTGQGFFKCPIGSTCQERDSDNPFYGTISFDNTADAFYSLFWVSTLTTWDPVMYATMDAVSPFTSFYFIGFVFCVSFFATNLVLAVIADNYGELVDDFLLQESRRDFQKWENDAVGGFQRIIRTAGRIMLTDEVKHVTKGINIEFKRYTEGDPNPGTLPIDRDFLRKEIMRNDRLHMLRRANFDQQAINQGIRQSTTRTHRDSKSPNLIRNKSQRTIVPNQVPLETKLRAQRMGVVSGMTSSIRSTHRENVGFRDLSQGSLLLKTSPIPRDSTRDNTTSVFGNNTNVSYWKSSLRSQREKTGTLSHSAREPKTPPSAENRLERKRPRSNSEDRVRNRKREEEVKIFKRFLGTLGEIGVQRPRASMTMMRAIRDITEKEGKEIDERKNTASSPDNSTAVGANCLLSENTAGLRTSPTNSHDAKTPKTAFDPPVSQPLATGVTAVTGKSPTTGYESSPGVESRMSPKRDLGSSPQPKPVVTASSPTTGFGASSNVQTAVTGVSAVGGPMGEGVRKDMVPVALKASTEQTKHMQTDLADKKYGASPILGELNYTSPVLTTTRKMMMIKRASKRLLPSAWPASPKQLMRIRMIHDEMKLDNARRELLGSSRLREALQEEWINLVWERSKMVIGLQNAVLEVRERRAPLEQHFRSYPTARKLYAFALHWGFQVALSLIILTDVAIAGANHDGISQQTETRLHNAALAMTALFTVELLIKICAMGRVYYFSSDFNKLDCLLVLVSLLEIAFGSSSMLSKIRSIRVFRVLLFMRWFERFRLLLFTVHDSLVQLLYIGGLLLLFVFIFTILGASFFAGRFGELDPVPRVSFDTFYRSFLVVFQMLSGDSWPDVTWAMVGVTSKEATLYSAALYIVGTYFVMNIFVAALLSQLGQRESLQGQTRRASLWLNQALDQYAWSGNYPAFMRFLTDQDDTENFFSKISQSLRFSRYHRKKGDKFGKDKGDLELEGKEEPKARQSNSLNEALDKNEDMDSVIELLRQLLTRTLHLKDKGVQRSLKLQEQYRELWTSPTKPVGVVFAALSPDNPYRLSVFNLVMSNTYEWVMAFVVLTSCIILAVDNPHSSRNDKYYRIIDLVLESIFTLEVVLKLIAFGATEKKYGYFRNPWNWPDFLSVLFGWLGIRAVKALRAFRPLRIIARSQGMQVVLTSLLRAFPEISNVAVFCLVLLYMLGVFGVGLFKGKFGFCLEEIGPGAPRSECPTGLWRIYDTNFDNIGNAMLTLFQLGTLSDWNEIMYKGIDAVGKDRNRELNANEPAGLYFVACVFLLGFFMVNLFVGALIAAFNDNKDITDGAFLMTDKQTIWRRMVLIVRSSQLLPFRADPPKNKCQALAFWIVGNGYDMFHPFEILISAMLLLNTVVICMQHRNQAQGFQDLEFWVGWIVTVAFVSEAIMKIVAWGPKYFKFHWNKFDFILALISLVTGLANANPEIANSLRLLRILRTLRFIRWFETLQSLFDTLFISLPATWNVFTLMVVVFFIFAVFGVQFFGRVLLTDNGFTDHANFKDFPRAMLTLFRLSTGDMWELVMYGATINESNSDCSEAEGTCGFKWAPVYFVLFITIGGLILINLFVAIVMENFSYQMAGNTEKSNLEILHAWRIAWSYFDRHNRGTIPCKTFLCVILAGPSPFGFGEPPLSVKNGIKLRVNRAGKPLQERTKDKILADIKNYEVFEPIRWRFLLSHLEIIRTPIWRINGKWIVRYKEMVNSIARLVFKIDENVYENIPDPKNSNAQWSIYEWYAAKVIWNWWRSIRRRSITTNTPSLQKHKLGKAPLLHEHKKRKTRPSRRAIIGQDSGESAGVGSLNQSLRPTSSVVVL